MADRGEFEARVLARLEHIECQLTKLAGYPSVPTPSIQAQLGQSVLRISLERVADGRKPFKLAIDGPIHTTASVSPVRAAILLIAFLDLQNRTEGGPGVLDPLLLMQQALPKLDGQGRSPEEVVENIRVGVYRTADWIGATGALRGASLSLELDPTEARMRAGGDFAPEQRLALRFSSSDTVVASIVDEVLGISPLARLRSSKASYYVPGSAGHDRLVLEFFDHQEQVSLHSLYTRPVTHSYPVPLLRTLGMSRERIRRAEVAQDGYRSGRIRCAEIMNRESLRQFFSRDENGRFTRYRAEVTQEQAKSHLEYMVTLLRTCPNYSIVLTDAVLPFLLGAYEINRPNTSEQFVMFYQAVESVSTFQTGSFVLADRGVYEGVQSKVIGWVMEHPTTNTGRDAVVDELLSLRSSM